MNNEFSEEWCLAMARLEGDSEIGAGEIAMDVLFDGEQIAGRSPDESQVAFGRFVRLMRRSHGLNVEGLSEQADVDILELVNIEEDPHYRPEVRTVYQLSNFFNLPQANLLQIAGLVAPKNDRIFEESIRFAARSEAVKELTAEERAALEAFVRVLTEKE